MTLPTVYVGIDCGKSGAIAAIYLDGKTQRAEGYHTPTTVVREKVTGKRAKTKDGKQRYSQETFYDRPGMLRSVNCYGKLSRNGWRVVVGIELQRGRPDDSKVTVFQVGRGQGMWEMAVTACGLSAEMISPNAWKPNYVTSGAGKQASKKACLDLYPLLPLPLVKDEAIAEATLIADYMMRLELGLPFPRVRGKPSRKSKVK